MSDSRQSSSFFPTFREPDELVVDYVETLRQPLKEDLAAKEVEENHKYEHVYCLVDADGSLKKGARIYALGCHGAGRSPQEEVADLMATLASGERPDFVLFLGDNFYDYGLDSPHRPEFKKLVHEMYAKLAALGIPTFAIQGNHDQNLHKKNFVKGQIGIKQGRHQVVASYLDEPPLLEKKTSPNLIETTDEEELLTTEKKTALYSGNTFTLDNPAKPMPFWNMPSRYYSLVMEEVQIFCIDSNNYVREYLEYIDAINNKLPAPKNNQAAWLFEQVQIAKQANPPRQVILSMHHPLVTADKRAYHGDADIYLKPDQLLRAKNLFQIPAKIKPSYNDLLRKVFEKQDERMRKENSKLGWGVIDLNNNNAKKSKPKLNFEFDAILCAHTHGACYYNNNATHDKYKIRQMTAGGGGGDLQNRKYFGDQEKMGIFRKAYGFLEVLCGNGKKTIDFIMHFTKDKSHTIQFTNQDCIPERTYPSTIDGDNVKALHKKVQTAITNYFAFIHRQQESLDENGNDTEKEKGTYLTRNLKHRNEGINRAHELWAYISHHQLDEYQTSLKQIYKIIKPRQLQKVSDHSLLTFLNKELKTVWQNEFIGQLEEYISMRRKETIDLGHAQNRTRYSVFNMNTLYTRYKQIRSKFGIPESVKVKAAENLITLIEQEQEQKPAISPKFDPIHVEALREDRLGRRVSKYELLGVLPESFKEIEASFYPEKENRIYLSRT